MRATSTTHPDHVKLTEQDRFELAVLVWMMRTNHRLGRRWSLTALAEAYGVSRKTADNCAKRYPL